MNYTINYKSNKENNLLTKIFKGRVVMMDIISSWEHIINKKLITNNHKGVISDYRETDFQIEIDDLQILQDFLNNNLNFFENLKVAVVLDSPKVVVPMVFEKNYLKINTKIFCTTKAATAWIKQ